MTSSGASGQILTLQSYKSVPLGRVGGIAE